MESRREDDELPVIQDDYNEDQSDQAESLPEVPASYRTTLLVLCILFAELFERLAFYGVAANLVLYCKDVLKLASPLSSSIVLAFQGTFFFTPIIGGWLGDAMTGRYNTIYGCSLIYIVATVLLTASTYYDPGAYGLSRLYQGIFLAVSLVLIFIAAGGFKANVSLLGADQVKNQGQEMVQKFFNWFYWFTQVGSLLAFAAVVYVQQKVSFSCGYLITAISTVCVTILVVIGRNHYMVYPPRGSCLTDTLHIICIGLRNTLCCRKNSLWTHWLDGAKNTLGGTFLDEMVEDVKSVVRLLPIFILFVFYWTIYGQGLTTYILQGSYMKLEITDTFSLPPAALNIFSELSLLVLIPFIDRVLYPGLRRFGFSFTPLRRIGVGMLFAVCSVALAGLIEVERKRAYGKIKQDVFNTTVNASMMSVFYLVPQYGLQATSEALVSVTGLEFAYSQSPAELRGVIMGVRLAMIGLGYYVASLLASIVKHASHRKWFPNNLNKGFLEYYMFLLAGLMLINAAVFLFVAVRYRYVDHDRERSPRPEDDDNNTTVFSATAVPVVTEVYPIIFVR